MTRIITIIAAVLLAVLIEVGIIGGAIWVNGVMDDPAEIPPVDIEAKHYGLKRWL